VTPFSHQQLSQSLSRPDQAWATSDTSLHPAASPANTAELGSENGTGKEAQTKVILPPNIFVVLKGASNQLVIWVVTTFSFNLLGKMG